MKRMILRKLSLTGENKDPATLIFEKGLNVISGDSDTGKTFAFQCLDYMLGKDQPPKEIIEAQGYSLITLEFSIDEEVYTLQRIIGEKKFTVIHNDNSQVLSCKHTAKKNNNISKFLLSLLLEKNENISVIKDKNNDVRTLSFRDLAHLCLISEIDIIAESSAFQSIQFVEKTVRSSILKYIITGEDDSLFSKKTSTPDEIRSSGVVDYLKVKKTEIEQRIFEIEDDTIFKSYLDNLDFKKSMTHIQDIRKQLSSMQDNLTCINNSIVNLNETCAEDEAKISKFKELEKHYHVELEKYDMITTYQDFISQLPNLSCPFCHQRIDSQAINEKEKEEIFVLWQASQIEIQQKLTDLSDLITDVQDRLNDKLKKLKEKKTEQDIIKKEIEKLGKQLNSLSNVVAEIRKFDQLDNTLKILKNDLKTIMGSIEEYSGKIANKTPPKRIIDDTKYITYCNIISQILNDWGFLQNIKLSFDPYTLDLTVNGKSRNTLGKGYRAFFMAAMTIGLMRYCRQNDCLHPGFVAIDSPLVSLKERKKDENGQWIDTYMEKKMIEDILENDSQSQVIIFENKDLKFDYNYNYVEYRHDGEIKGFIKMPTK